MEATGQSEQKTVVKFGRLAIKLFNQLTNVAYRWKAHFIGYPSTDKSPYVVSQIRQFLRFKPNNAWKTVNKKLWSSLKPSSGQTI